MKTTKQAKAEHPEYSKLIGAVCRSLDKEDFFNVYNHGISGGYGGFIYYSDTVKFWRANRQQIILLLEEEAEQFGMGVLEMIKGFRCVGDVELSEIGHCLYGNFSHNRDTVIYNALAWFAAEEVVRWFCEE